MSFYLRKYIILDIKCNLLWKKVHRLVLWLNKSLPSAGYRLHLKRGKNVSDALFV